MKINGTKEKKETITNKLGHLNHMDGVSYSINDPIKQLRIVASTCFFGEPKYYHQDVKISAEAITEPESESKMNKHLDSVLGKVLSYPGYHNFSASRLVETAIDAALAFDAEKTLQEAVRLRNEENIRTTPQVIMVRAANHESVRGTSLITKYASQIMVRTDEASVQLAYQKQVFGKTIPNALKKSWKTYLEKCSEFDLAKYLIEEKSISCSNMIKILENIKIEDITRVFDVGERVARSVVDYFNNKKNIDLIERLLDAGIKITFPKLNRKKKKLNNQIFVLTGTLEIMTRNEAESLIRDNGGNVSSSVSKKTSYVVAGSDPGSKYDNARSLGVHIISEQQFINMLK